MTLSSNIRHFSHKKPGALRRWEKTQDWHGAGQHQQRHRAQPTCITCGVQGYKDDNKTWHPKPWDHTNRIRHRRTHLCVYMCMVYTQTYAYGCIHTHVSLFNKFLFPCLNLDCVTQGGTRHPPVPLSFYTRIYGNHCVSENKHCGTCIEYRHAAPALLSMKFRCDIPR